MLARYTVVGRTILPQPSISQYRQFDPTGARFFLMAFPTSHLNMFYLAVIQVFLFDRHFRQQS